MMRFTRGVADLTRIDALAAMIWMQAVICHLNGKRILCRLQMVGRDASNPVQFWRQP
ncbi:hypothetical protein [Maliponia aquimaris]|uniref:hypothetical protein n=1 Tax=Maliponia aquimaris TaxID=1673631 RepID=UPI0015954362|nr:hypothetical protein [Maliponia aquimaris]